MVTVSERHCPLPSGSVCYKICPANSQACFLLSPEASYGQLKVLNGLRKWDKAEERWTQYLGVLSWWVSAGIRRDLIVTKGLPSLSDPELATTVKEKKHGCICKGGRFTWSVYITFI